jgi:hypothetical protein
MKDGGPLGSTRTVWFDGSTSVARERSQLVAGVGLARADMARSSKVINIQSIVYKVDGEERGHKIRAYRLVHIYFDVLSISHAAGRHRSALSCLAALILAKKVAQDVENGYDAERSLRHNVRSRGQNLAEYPLGHGLPHWWPRARTCQQPVSPSGHYHY